MVRNGPAVGSTGQFARLARLARPAGFAGSTGFAGLAGLAQLAVFALLAVLAMSVGLSGPGWVVGLACGVVLTAAVAGSLARSGADRLGPADLVTLTRATLACGVAALTAESIASHTVATTLVTLAVVALVLDAVDGWVARSTRTVSAFGARFDGEVDAFLILVLSVYVAGSVGWWVLAIGAARYGFALAGLGLPWLRAQLPPRYWRKVVTAALGIVLAVAAADILPRRLTEVALVVALALLAESFGRDVLWLWRHRRVDVAVRGSRSRWRVAPATGSVAANVLALLLVWFALVAPNQPGQVTLSIFLRVPVEALALAGVALVLPSKWKRTMAAVVGVLLALLTIVKALDMGFFAALDRSFRPVTDWSYFGPAVGLVDDMIGRAGAILAVVAAAALVVAVFVCMPLAVGRLTGLMARHRKRSVHAVTGLVAVGAVTAVTGMQVGGGEAVTSANASQLFAGKVRTVVADANDLQKFERAAAVDHYRDRADLLGALRGKDVLFVFIESYGRVAIEGPDSSQVGEVLDDGTSRLREAGYSSRSAFLTSPTFGGLSWLAHSTLHSGLWIDNQLRYDRLLDSDRLTLGRAFSREGWRTVALKPNNKEPWPEGKNFYRFDTVYDRWELGYQGPEFGWSAMPDQFALSALQRLELAERDRAPVLAEVDLTSTHSPWAPIPRLVDWNSLGDGSVFDEIHDRARSREELWSNPENVGAAYADSIVYSLNAFISFVEEFGDEDLVVVLLGDHQPIPAVSGHGASHDVPVTVIANDPTVIERMSGWGWQDGMRPDPQAPVWSMDAFRDRFLGAYTLSAPPASSSMPARPPTGDP